MLLTFHNFKMSEIRHPKYLRLIVSNNCLICIASFVKYFFFAYSGNLYPSAMRVLKDGRLHVSFTTRAHFNGKFVMQHSTFQGIHAYIHGKGLYMITV